MADEARTFTSTIRIVVEWKRRRNSRAVIKENERERVKEEEKKKRGHKVQSF